MSNYAIRIGDLRKVYGSRRPVTAVDGLDLEVPLGGVFGFLGPNGAGKTTTIRALVGHLRPTSGHIELLGAGIPRQLDAVVDQVGALVEQPSFFPGFSGRRNLALLARGRGFPEARVDEVLGAVGLTDRADTRFAGYSLGMKQRLGVAAVLLKDPGVLILDEPTNGLDPGGMLEMRTMIRRLGAEGRTVFISSHLLSEVQQTCDRVAVVVRGRCVASGSVGDLLRGGVSRYRLRVPGGEPVRQRAESLLRTSGTTVSSGEGDSLVVQVTADRAHEVNRLLAGAGIFLAELSPIERTLEEAFIELTSDGNRP
jgi:ABC-2 type transport system ATP-binding protein